MVAEGQKETVTENEKKVEKRIWNFYALKPIYVYGWNRVCTVQKKRKRRIKKKNRKQCTITLQCVTHHKPLPNINNIENGNLTEEVEKNVHQKTVSIATEAYSHFVDVVVVILLCISHIGLFCRSARKCFIVGFAQCATDVIPITMSHCLTTAKMFLRQRMNGN